MSKVIKIKKNSITPKIKLKIIRKNEIDIISQRIEEIKISTNTTSSSLIDKNNNNKVEESNETFNQSYPSVNIEKPINEQIEITDKINNLSLEEDIEIYDNGIDNSIKTNIKSKDCDKNDNKDYILNVGEKDPYTTTRVHKKNQEEFIKKAKSYNYNLLEVLDKTYCDKKPLTIYVLHIKNNTYFLFANKDNIPNKDKNKIPQLEDIVSACISLPRLLNLD
jgi:hypothetical protein